MRSRKLLREIAQIESDLRKLEVENALISLMENSAFMDRLFLEERKVIRYALDNGIASKRDLNEGTFADVALGLGQAIGSLPGLNVTGVGAAFGAAGVLYYGRKMLASTGFDQLMNAFFTMMSAAAIEPTGVFGQAGVVGKLLKPFVTLGEWARKLGTGLVTGAKSAFQSLSGANKMIVQGAVRAEGPIMTGINFVKNTVLPKLTNILDSVKGMVTKLPGGEAFGKIVARLTQSSSGAVASIERALTSLIKLGKNALGKGIGKAAVAANKAGLLNLNKMLAGKTFAYTTTKGAARNVAFKGIEDGVIKLVVPGGRGAAATGFPVAAAELPQLAVQIAKTQGKEAAEALLTTLRGVTTKYGPQAIEAAEAALTRVAAGAMGMSAAAVGQTAGAVGSTVGSQINTALT